MLEEWNNGSLEKEEGMRLLSWEMGFLLPSVVEMTTLLAERIEMTGGKGIWRMDYGILGMEYGKCHD